jgi:hypothetical protein
LARDGSGNYSLPSGNPVVTGTAISSSDFNTTMNDIVTALTASVAKDGQTTMTGNLPMGTYKLTGLGNGSARTDSVAVGQIEDGSFTYVGTVGGTADVITLTAAPAISSYTAGQTFRFIAGGTNTTAVTVAVSGLAAKDVTKQGSTALAAGDIQSGAIVSITYDGTRFQLAAPTSSAVAPAALLLPAAAAPAQTADGSVVWDSNDDLLTVGTGAARKTMVDTDSTQTLTTKTLTTPTINGAATGTTWTGHVLQVVNGLTTAYDSTTNLIPVDDTVPQQGGSEGKEFMTKAITPTHADNKLRIDVVAVMSHTVDTATLVLALFQDATASALSAAMETVSAAGGITTVKLTHYMTAGTTSETTFKVRAGSATAGTTGFNGAGGGRLMGGVAASSITITEVKV